LTACRAPWIYPIILGTADNISAAQIRAAVALERKEPNKAVELLKAASGIELESIGYLYPVYVRGEIFLSLHDSNAAATEFQKFIDHRGVVANFPLGALARLQLAHAYAKATYQDFLTLCKDADPAKAEYAKLQ
jgi:hypothetical protein